MPNLIGIFGNCGECGMEYAVFAKTDSVTHRCPSCGIENDNCNEWYALGDREAMAVKPVEIINEMKKQLTLACSECSMLRDKKNTKYVWCGAHIPDGDKN